MKKTPNTKWYVTNGIDTIQGQLEYVKNVHFDESGYATLSAPLVKIFSSEDDGGFGLPTNVFSYNANKYKVITDSTEAFNINLSALTGTQTSDGKGWLGNGGSTVWNNNNFFVAADDIYEYDASADNSTFTSRISGEHEYIELFQSRNTIVGAQTNVVKQYDTAYAGSNDLTLSENLEITGIKFSNSKIGIATRQRKNDGDALFIVWDGVSEGSNQQVPISDSFILSVAPFASSWVVFTSNGQILYFNGGGFSTLAELPGYRYEDELNSLTPSTAFDIGQNIHTEGDILYINVPTLPEFSRDNKPYRIGYHSGVWCYEPTMADPEYKLGLYHRHSLSNSKYVNETGTISSNVITFGSAHMLETGDRVWVNNSFDTLTAETMYYAVKVDSTSIKLATTYDNAINNTTVSIANGSTDMYFVKRYDYGIDLIRSIDLGLCRKFRQQATYNTTGVLPFFAGAKVRPSNVTSSRVSILNALAPKMENIGYLYTTKYSSSNKTDVYSGVVVKYKKLKDGDTIKVKAKTSDFEPIYVGNETLHDSSYTGEYVIWDRANRFTTTADLSNALKGHEVYIFEGAGCGQSAHIQSIENNGAGVYTVTLTEDMRGITSLATSCVVIDDYVYLGEVTKNDTAGVKSFGLGMKAKDMKVKLMLKGVNIKVSEIQAIDNQFELSL